MSPQQPADAGQLDRVGYLFGYPIAHSLSPPFHQAIFDDLGLKWSQQYLESLDIQQFLHLTRDPKFFGAAVTMPHKVAIIPHLDELTSEARDVGACNTVFVRERDGKRVYIGTNTDVKGVKRAFYENVKTPDAVFHDRPAMVIGGGGAARSAVYALRKWMKVKQIYLVNREASEVDAVIQECNTRGYGQDLVHVRTTEQARTLEGPGAIVACVPDFPPKTDAEKVARGIIEVMLAKEHKGAILEMCYHPNPWTAIAGLAEKHQWQVILGTEAMIWQGLEQSRYWRDEEVPPQVVKKVHEVIAAKLSEMRSTSTTTSSISATPAQAVQQEEMTPIVPPTTS